MRRAAAPILLVALSLAGLAASAAGSSTSRPGATAAIPGNVIIRARPGRVAEAEKLVVRLGGSIRLPLRLIGGFSATLPSRAVAKLRHSGLVASVTANRALRPQSSSYTADYDPSTDGYSMSQITQLTGARDWWKAGYTGKGVDIALIDSGVAPVQGLSSPDQLVNGADLSVESQAGNLRYLDTYGHGTFMAGLIAGRDSAPSPSAPAATYLGMAPDARIVSLKVASADGGTDVTQVIAAIDWVVQHRDDNGLNIRVINLSYGTNSLQPYQKDPLAYAVEQAWKAGIVVVTAAGNSGMGSGLADPAYDPWLISVGAADTMGTPSLSDDQPTSFTASPSACPPGPISCSPTLLAPGAHMQGLRVAGSYTDQNNPDAALGDLYLRGSGTSEAAAYVSGAVALLLQKYPGLTPDQVKQMLSAGAQTLPGCPSLVQGDGELDLNALLKVSAPNLTPGPRPRWSTGSGSLELSRGTAHLSMDGIVLQGEQDIFGQPFSSTAMAALEAAGNSWSGGIWNGSTWSGNSWNGNSWSGSTWSGNTWSGHTWSGSTWSGHTWSGNSWSGNTWSGSTWSASTWSGNTWSGDHWLGATWGR